MKEFSFDTQPKVRVLTDDEILAVHDGTMRVLEEAGILFESDKALDILEKLGCRVERLGVNKGKAYITRKIAENAIKAVPATFELWDRENDQSYTIGGDNYYFDPGSSGLNFLDSDGETVRPNTTEDMINVYRLTDGLNNIKLQSTALSVDDVPDSITDVYRLWQLVKNSKKPFLSGAFNDTGADRMIRLLTALRGSDEARRQKPLGIMDVCSQPPLKWGDVSCSNLIDFANADQPIETISVPMPGAASPATMAGSIIVHLAESISGMVLVQAVRPGARMVLGGAPMTFDMRYSTTSLNAPETSLIANGYAQLARYYGVPCHNYACLADPKLVDIQAGAESALSALAAVLGGINIISGPGMIDFVNTFSLEKLLVDNEIIAMVDRIYKGVVVNEETLAVDLIIEMGSEGDYLKTKHTRKYFRQETYVPPAVIDKKSRASWTVEGESKIEDRARDGVKAILDKNNAETIDAEKAVAVDKVMKEIISELGVGELPVMPE